MNNVADKLREARQKLGFSQEYVSECVGLSRSAVTQIELGNRKVTTEEAALFCKLYHISADYLLETSAPENRQTVFARGFDELNEADQREILNLIAFKKAMTENSRGVDAES